MITDSVKLHPTKINVSADAREQLVEMLNKHLATYSDLLAMLLEAHWNVRGPRFIAQHKLFEEIHDTLEPHTDDLAERITTLGGFAQGTIRRAAQATSLEELPDQVEGDFGYLDALTDRLSDVANLFRSGIRHSDEAGDPNTADLLTGISRDLDKMLWFLEAHRNA